MEKPADVGDRQLDALLGRLDRIAAELERLNRTAEHQEGFTPRRGAGRARARRRTRREADGAGQGLPDALRQQVRVWTASAAWTGTSSRTTASSS